MTDIVKTARDRIGVFKELLWVVMFVTPIIYSSIVGLYVLNRNWVLPIVKSELGVTQVEADLDNMEGLSRLPVELAKLSTAIIDMQAALKQINGENRLFIQTPGTTYITAPVYTTDEAVTYNTEFRRTALGANCELIRSESVFTDERNESYTGGPAEQKRQVGMNPQRVRQELRLPRRQGAEKTPLLPGRVELRILVSYDCNGISRQDEAERVSFILQEPS